MKNFLAIIFTAIFLLTCAACGAVEEKNNFNEDIPDEGETITTLNFKTKKILLNSGYEMPIIGMGTYALDYDTCVNSVMTLIKNGGRLIDTAYMYRNEDAVGEGVRRAMKEYGVPREEIFIITKIYPNQFKNPNAAIEQALNKLNVGYVDMMLLHHPGADDVKAYRAMEEFVVTGKIRSLGLSNFYVKELENFLPQVTITPALVQNEIHPYYQERDVVPFIQSKNIVVQSWYPLGGRGYTETLLNDSTIKKLPPRIMFRPRRLFCAGICNAELFPCPVPEIQNILQKILTCLDLN